MIDVRFISDLIDRLQQDYAIDPARIYVNGLSNGGGMTYLLACELSGRIAAVGSVAGAYLYPLDQLSAGTAGTIDRVSWHRRSDRAVFRRTFPVF